MLLCKHDYNMTTCAKPLGVNIIMICNLLQKKDTTFLKTILQPASTAVFFIFIKQY